MSFTGSNDWNAPTVITQPYDVDGILNYGLSDYEADGHTPAGNRPALQGYGAQRFVMSIQGDGSEWEIWVQGDYQGPSIALWESQDADPKWHLVSSSADSANSSRAAQQYKPAAAVRATLASGKAYMLEIGSAARDNDPVNYNQSFRVIARHSALIGGGDHRDSPVPITIASDGAHFTGSMLNAGFTTASNSGLDDPTGSQLAYTGWFIYRAAGTGTVSYSITYVPANASFLGNQLYRQTGDGLVRVDGTSAPVVPGDTLYIQVGSQDIYNGQHALAQFFNVDVTGPKSIDQAGGGTTEPTDNRDLTGDSDPKTATCSSLLDLIRQFQTDTKSVVRIIDDHTIAFVDPKEPLPTGFDASNGEDYYTAWEQDLASTTKVLLLQSGRLDLTASATLENDDVAIVTSGYQIPGRLPFPGLKPAPANGITYTFTPEGFTSSVTFVYPDPPVQVRRT
jgi:hypothetical protein